MGLIGEQFLRPRPAPVLSSKQAHGLSPRSRGDQGERNAERGEDAFDDAGGAAEGEGRGHALARHRPDLLNHSVGVFGMGLERLRQPHSVNLIDSARAAFDFGCRHINDDEATVL